MLKSALKEYLKETEYLNYSHPSINSFVSDIKFENDIKNAIAIYYRVRDFQLYDPFHLNLSRGALKASNILLKKRAWCVEKTILMTSCARFMGIPARMGFAIVKNHLQTDKLEKYLKKQEIVFHGFVELYLQGKWVKCTPAFDKRICRVSGVSPLDFDGYQDSLFHAFEGKDKFMEYVHFYGMFSDVPIELMKSEMKKHYPHLFEKEYNSKEFSFIYK